MNILILTPDAVGSTLLQRLITIYMQFYDFDKPVINLHELTNGLQKYFSPDFNREIVSKKKVTDWGYYQSLEEIVRLLQSVDHYKTSRLAQYHIQNRQDSVAAQTMFYQYLNDNFFIIACRRHNIFEHALSMSVNHITKKLNVFSHEEKISTFLHMYLEPIQIDEQVFTDHLDHYKDYLAWSDKHFNISSFFYYDQHLAHIEKYILDLPIWTNGGPRLTWKDKFGLDLNDWNRCHHIPSDLFDIAHNRSRLMQLLSQDPTAYTLQQRLICQDNDADDTSTQSTNALVQTQEILPSALSMTKRFIADNIQGYQKAQSAIKAMQDLDIIVTPPPIKKQTMAEKIAMVKNLGQCLTIYNAWIGKNHAIGSELSLQDLENQIESESKFWYEFRLPPPKSGPPSIE